MRAWCSLVVCTILVCAVGEVVAEPTTCPSTQAVSEEITLDLGIISGSQLHLQKIIRWTNPTGHLLKLARIPTSCGCTSVTPNRKVIGPNDNVELSVDVDVRNWFGNGSVVFVVMFEDNVISPIRFRLNFFRHAPLNSDPEVIDFGIVDNPVQAKRHFRIFWISTDTNDKFSLSGEAYSENKAVQCKSTEQRNKTFRLPNSNEVNTRYEILFEVSLTTELNRGNFEDVIHIPVETKDKSFEYNVPLRGEYRGRVFARPSQIVATTQDKSKTEELSFEILRQNWVREPVKIEVSCDDPNVSVRFVRNSTENLSVLGNVCIKSADDLQHSVRSNISILCDIDSDREIFHVPLRILFIGDTCHGHQNEQNR